MGVDPALASLASPWVQDLDEGVRGVTPAKMIKDRRDDQPREGDDD